MADEKKSLREIFGSKARTEFEFLDVLKEQSQRDGSTILVFVLKNPIPQVTGRVINDQVSGNSERLLATEVEEVRVGQETIEELYKLDEEAQKAGKPSIITWTEMGKSGKISTDVGLDVSNSLQVWLTKTPFAQFGREQRAKRSNDRRSNLVAKMQEQKAKRTLANADTSATGDKKPEAVESTGSADDNGKGKGEGAAKAGKTAITAEK